MTSDAKTVEAYIASLNEDRKPVIVKIDRIITDNLDGAYSRNMQYGMISYTIPHSIYPGGYHCKPSDEVPFISVASQKNHVSIYHMGLYTDSGLLQWLKDTFTESNVKLDLGKCCIRFKKIDQMPYEIITKLVKKSSTDEYVSYYRSVDRRTIKKS